VTEVRPGTSTPWRRDPTEVKAGLAGWARAFRNPAAVVDDVRVPASGMANDTVLFHLDSEPLVARLAPAPGSPYPTFPTFDLEGQRRVMELVRRRTEVPVPEILHLERSDAWLGVPFLVMRAVDGVVPSDNPPYLFDGNGWFLQGTPEERKQLETTTIEVLAQLHTIVDDSGDTAFLRPDTPGATALAQQLSYQRWYYDWARDGVTIPILEHAIEVLERTLPANDRRVLNWGDSRPGNIIYRDFAPVAVLDWEMATVGPPEVDVAWATFFHRFFAGMAERNGLAVLAMFDRAETAASYERFSGQVLSDLAWYEAFAGLRFAIILARMFLRASAFGGGELPADPNDLIMFAPLLAQLLADL
jgi:aminoglycoside phosphotransferase (APT) family kinase protein